MLNYIQNIIGLHAKIDKWNQLKLPLFLQQNREYWVLHLLETDCLVIKMNTDSFDISSYQKQKIQLNKYCSYPIILCFDTISSYQRQALIQKGISFVVPNSQLYIPFMGISLREYYETSVKVSERLTSMAQYLLLYFIYDKQKEAVSQIELARILNISAMNVSRSAQELESLNLVELNKIGRITYIKLLYHGLELYLKAKDYMINPIQKKIYLHQENLDCESLIAGEEALARRSMLNPPSRRIRAIDKRIGKNVNKEILNPNWSENQDYIELELWKYNPNQYAIDGMVDIISLTLSLQDVKDERVEAQINKMLEEYVW